MFYLIKGPFVHLETRITLSFENSMINITGHFLLQQRRQIRFGCKIGSPAESVISAAAAAMLGQQQQQQYNKKNPLLVNETREVSIMYLVQTLLIACRSREVHANKSGNKHFYVFSLSPASSSSSSKPKRCFKEPCYYLT